MNGTFETYNGRDSPNLFVVKESVHLNIVQLNFKVIRCTNDKREIRRIACIRKVANSTIADCTNEKTRRKICQAVTIAQVIPFRNTVSLSDISRLRSAATWWEKN